MDQETEKRPRRFGTLLVCAVVIAAGAAIGVPWVLAMRRSAGEAAASAQLLLFRAAQTQFQGGGYQDGDLDHVGEYGQIGHLTGELPTNKIDAGRIRMLTGELASRPGTAPVKAAGVYGFTAWTSDACDRDENPVGPPIMEGSPLAIVVDYGQRPLSRYRGRTDLTCNGGERHWLIAAVPLDNLFASRVLLMYEDGRVRTAPDPAVWMPEGVASRAGMQAGLDHVLARPASLAEGLVPACVPVDP